MAREVVFTGDIFRMQPLGGITQVFLELMFRLERPWRVVAGLHQSLALNDLGDRVHSALRAPSFPTSPRLYGLVNRVIDRRLKVARSAILHPTYYRDPRQLPSSIPVVATVHDMAHERFPDLFRRKPWSSRDPATFKAALCQRADLIVCVSESTRTDLLEFLDVPEQKVRVVKHGRRAWITPPDPISGVQSPFFLWIGERHTYKNFARTLEAWVTLHDTAETTLLCIGGGPWRRSERALLQRLGITHRVRQLQATEAQLRWAYENATGLLYTSLCEGFGLPIVEAMSLGCEVVTSNLSSMPEIACDLAHFADPEDLGSLQRAMTTCLTTDRCEQRRSELVSKAATYSWESAAAAMDAVYQELE